jgi:AraC family transcriptional regulator
MAHDPQPLVDVAGRFNHYRQVVAVPLHDPRSVMPLGVRASSARFPNFTYDVSFPALAEDTLIIQLQHPCHLQGKIDQRFACDVIAGDILIVPRGIATEFRFAGGHDILNLAIPPELLATIALQATDYDPAHIELIPRIATPDPLVHALGHAILAELQSHGRAGPLYLESLTHTLAIHLLHTHTSVPVPLPRLGRTVSRHTLRRVLEYIDANLDRNLTLTELAGVVHLSPYHLAHLFKHAIGQPLHHYVLAQRLQAGKTLLATTDLSVAEVARRVGFVDHSHFGRHFKQQFGMAPSHVARPGKNIHNTRKNIPFRRSEKV